MYLPMIGLILILIDFASRLKFDRKALAMACSAIILVAAGATYARAQVWSDPIALWEDTARKSPAKSRAHFQLGFAYYQQQRYDLAVPELERAATLGPPDYDLLVDLGLAYDGLHQYGKAMEALQRAARMEPTAHVYSQIGKVLAEQSKWKEAMDAFDQAEKADPNFPATYAYKGLVHLATGDAAGSLSFFQRALAIDPQFQPAREGLAQAEQRLRAAPR
jgi:tetratricopeptide (TPR) repeat protein